MLQQLGLPTLFVEIIPVMVGTEFHTDFLRLDSGLPSVTGVRAPGTFHGGTSVASGDLTCWLRAGFDVTYCCVTHLALDSRCL